MHNSPEKVLILIYNSSKSIFRLTEEKKSKTTRTTIMATTLKHDPQ